MDKTGATPVAVIGMACRLPGGIDSPDLLWQALLRGDDLVTEVPPNRWDVDEYYDPEPGVPGRSVCRWGSFLDNVADFDPEFFGITEREATAMDPQHRLLLEASWEAMEHSGLTRDTLARLQTGVFVGLMHDDYQFVHADSEALEGPYGYMGNSFAMGSGRIAYTMGLQGPAMTVDTACSSGLAAVHLACRSLHDGESDITLAGGASVMFEPRKGSSGSAIGMLSASGRCHAFDVAADGFVPGEGAVMLLLKRLPDALADGDRILAVVRGTAANQDGHTVNIVTPSAEAQTAAYHASLAAADVDPDTVGMVEAHGPGTPVGDPIEYSSLAEVYGSNGPCALGSVKTNFGHTQSAAGALGLMKTVLALQHGVVPQNLHFTSLPDELAQIDTELFVPQENTPWPKDSQHAPRRAAVSSYGFSGTNVHAIVEQAPEPATTAATQTTTAISGALLFPLSSSSEDGLRQTAGRLADWVHAQGPDLAASDLAYTLTRRRGHRPVRTTVLASTTAELAEALRDVATDELPYPPAVGQDDRGPVWIFSGQGSQWAAMGADLLANERGLRRNSSQHRTTDRRRIRILGNRSNDRHQGRHRHRPGATHPVHHASLTGRDDESTRRHTRRGHRSLPGRVRRSRSRRSAVASRRGACHLPPLETDDPNRRLRSNGIGGTTRPGSDYRTGITWGQRCGGGGGGLTAIHRDRWSNPDRARPRRRLGRA